MVLESIPPLRNRPSGTSLIRRRAYRLAQQIPEFLDQRALV